MLFIYNKIKLYKRCFILKVQKIKTFNEIFNFEDYIKNIDLKNIIRNRIELSLKDRKIEYILLNIDFTIGRKKEDTMFFSFNDKSAENNLLEIFQIIYAKKEPNNIKMMEYFEHFILKIKKFLDEINVLLKSKNVEGIIVFEYDKDTLPKEYNFNGKIDDYDMTFVSKDFDLNYFNNINFNMFKGIYDDDYF